MKVTYKFKEIQTGKEIELPVIISKDINEYSALHIAFETLTDKLGISEDEVRYKYNVVEVPDIYQIHDNDDARAFILNEGTAYATQHYISHLYFKDPKTRKLWKECSDLLYTEQSLSDDVKEKEEYKEKVDKKLTELEEYLELSKEQIDRYFGM